MDRNQKFGLLILLVVLVVLTGAVYILVESSNQNEFGVALGKPLEEVYVPEDTVYGPVDMVTGIHNSDKDTTPVTVAEQMPEFPGGQDGMIDFLNENLRYPQPAKEHGIHGKVLIDFVVDKNGNVKNVEIEKGIGGGCDEEAIRVIRKMPRWKPGRQDEQPVNVKFRFPINFSLK